MIELSEIKVGWTYILEGYFGPLKPKTVMRYNPHGQLRGGTVSVSSRRPDGSFTQPSTYAGTAFAERAIKSIPPEPQDSN